MENRNEVYNDLYVVWEKGPDIEYGVMFQNKKDAEEFVDLRKDWWKDFVLVNKVPERSFCIKRYVVADD